MPGPNRVWILPPMNRAGSHAAAGRAVVEALSGGGHRPVLALAPMEGVSDAVARDLLGGLGGMDFCVSEFVRVTDRPLASKALIAACPELRQGGRTPSGTPVWVQLLGSNRPALAASAVLAAELGAPGIDLNFGCPAKRVNGHDGGAALLRDAARVERTVAAVRTAVPDAVPVSAKIRLGWDDPSDVVALTRAAEGGGASFVTIHGRTKVQMYRPPARWDRIGEAARAVSVPVIANGDLFTPDDLHRCAHATGCTGFMIGRGAFRRPNLFRWMRGLDPGPWRPAEVAALIREFALRVVDSGRFRAPERAALARTKQWLRYAAETDQDLAERFERAKRTQTLDEALRAMGVAPLSTPLDTSRPMPSALHSDAFSIDDALSAAARSSGTVPSMEQTRAT